MRLAKPSRTFVMTDSMSSRQGDPLDEILTLDRRRVELVVSVFAISRRVECRP